MRANVLKVLSGNTIAAALSFLLSMALARMMSVEAFGEISYAITVSMMLAYLVGGGVGNFSIVTLPRAEDKALFVKQINGFLAKASGLLLLAAIPAVMAIAWWKGESAAYLVGASVVSALGIVVIQQTFAVHQANGEFGTYSKQQALTNLVRTLLVIGSAFAVNYVSKQPELLVVSASTLAFVLVAFAMVFKYSNYWKISAGNESYKPWRKDLLHMVATACIISLAARIDQLIGKELLTPEAFGQYALASTLSMAFTLLQGAFMSVSLHSAAQGGSWENVREQQKKLGPWLIGLSLAVVALSPWAIPFVFGARYAGSVQVFQVLSLVTISGMWFTPVESYFSATKAKAVTQVKMLQMVGAFGLGIGAGYLFGAVGMAVAILASRWIGWAKLQYMGNTVCLAR